MVVPKDWSKISVADLRMLCAVMLDEVERTHGPMVDLDADYYWDMRPHAAYAMVAQPELFIDVGQLSDDLDELRSLLAEMRSTGAREDGKVLLFSDLATLAQVLRRIAHQSGPQSELRRPSPPDATADPR